MRTVRLRQKQASADPLLHGDDFIKIYPDALNLGLLDQIAALRWIKENISAFGGDPMFTYNAPKISRYLAKKLLQETSTTNMEELMQLSTQKLKEAQQKLALDLASGPTREGKLIPPDMHAAYRDGMASKELKELLRFLDNKYPAVANDVRAYIDEQTSTMPELEAKAKVYEQFYTLDTYYCAQKLTEGGNKVHLLYWNVKPLIENLGSGTVDVAAAFLGSRKTVQCTETCKITI